MRILLLSHAFNSLTQRLFVELGDRGHLVSVEFDINDAITIEAVSLFRPDLIIAPFLKRAIPETVWRGHVCLVVHPGVRGDRGPSALDWAILEQQEQWGVTVLQANGEMDAGDIWAHGGFPMRRAAKAAIYRCEAADAASEAMLLAVERFEGGKFTPRPLDYRRPEIRGRSRPSVRQVDRAIDWNTDGTETVVRKINSADGYPGLLDSMFDRRLFLFDAHPEPELRGRPGALVAKCGPALCRATADGAVWLGHVRDPDGPHPFKLPATRVLAGHIGNLPEVEHGYDDIRYVEDGACGYLYFDFYNGAMGVDQCRRLLAAYRAAKKRPTRVIALMGGRSFWSNGMHLNLIEAADSPADESWANINAIDDLAQEIIETESHLTVSALAANAGAGGVFLARAADRVWGRRGVIVNPHYKDMGNLYGSEFWTYLLPRYAGPDNTRRIVEARLPMGMREAAAVGLVDDIFDGRPDAFQERVKESAAALAVAADSLLPDKITKRRRDESEKPLNEYRREELARMRLNFSGFDQSYHVARYNFVCKVVKSRTPPTIAVHRNPQGGLRKVS